MQFVYVDGQPVKVACAKCIKGHRASQCRHTDRVLVQVRRPGRPDIAGAALSSPGGSGNTSVFYTVPGHKNSSSCSASNVNGVNRAVSNTPACVDGDSPSHDAIPGGILYNQADPTQQVEFADQATRKYSFIADSRSYSHHDGGSSLHSSHGHPAQKVLGKNFNSPMSHANLQANFENDSKTVLPTAQNSCCSRGAHATHSDAGIDLPMQNSISSNDVFKPQETALQHHKTISSKGTNSFTPQSTYGPTTQEQSVFELSTPLNGNTELPTPAPHHRAWSQRLDGSQAENFDAPSPELTPNTISYVVDTAVASEPSSCCNPQSTLRSGSSIPELPTQNLTTGKASSHNRDVNCTASYKPHVQSAFDTTNSSNASDAPNALSVRAFDHTSANLPSWNASLHSQGPSFQPIQAIPHIVDDCTCGNTCRCLGCLTHPSNDITMEYVQNAWDVQGTAEYPEDSDSPHIATVPTAFSPPPDASETSLPNNLYGHGVASGQGQQRQLSEVDLTQQDLDAPCFIHQTPTSLCQNADGICRCGDNCVCQGCVLHSGHNNMACDRETLEMALMASKLQVKSEQNMTMTVILR